jgi:hypothetical protein
MSSHAFVCSHIAALLLLICGQIGQALAQPASASARAIWHCSRNAADAQTTAEVAIQNEFKLSSMDTIGVTLTDLINVYSGKDVRLGNMPLIGCFMPGQDDLSNDILKSLDLKPYVLQKLKATSSIVQSQVVTVTDEQQMQACLNKYFPAFGYFSSETVTDKFAPCF